MNRGKQKCKILKEIRKQIAEANQIDLIISECSFKGECKGTCPKCEAEIRYLEQQLAHTSLMGTTTRIMGVSLGVLTMAGGLTACNSKEKRPSNEEGIEGNAVTITTNLAGEIMIGNGNKPDELYNASAAEINWDSAITNGDMEIPVVGGVDEMDEVIEDSITHDEELMGAFIKEAYPVFPGGQMALMEFVRNHIEYTDEVKSAIEEKSRVIVSFTVEIDGSISNIKVVRSVNEVLDNEAIRIIQQMPKWEPAEREGGKVACWFTMPVSFIAPEEE